MKPRSREIGCYNDRITLKFDTHLDSAAAELPVKFPSDWKSLNPNLAPLRLCVRFCGKMYVRLVNRGTGIDTNDNHPVTDSVSFTLPYLQDVWACPRLQHTVADLSGSQMALHVGGWTHLVLTNQRGDSIISHDDVIKWKQFLRYWPMCGSPVTGEFPSQRSVTRCFDVFFDLRLNKWLNK